MAKPDSLTTAIRMWLADIINPRPPHGTAWCVRCSLNNGRTFVMKAVPKENSAVVAAHHANDHQGRDEQIWIRSS